MDVSDPVELASRIGAAREHLVIVDFDGTLAPIVDRPEDARLAPGAEPVLRRLAARTRVAICSGRDLDDLRRRTADLPVTLIGGHGARIADADGVTTDLLDVAAVTDTLDAAEREILDLVGDEPGWLSERKPTSLAVHHRLVPVEDEAERLPRVRAVLERRTGDEPGYEVLDGKSVIELRPRGVNKGVATAWLADRFPERRLLVLGDDTTDEDAFSVADARGGLAILVADDDRPTGAHARLADPTAVVALLHQLTLDEEH